MKFNYSQLHYFDSKGREMPLVYNAPRITFSNPRFESEYGEYLIVRKDGDTDDVYFKKTSTGKRFTSNDDIKCILTSASGTYNITVPNNKCHFEEYTSTYKYKDTVTGEDKNECYLSSFCESYVLESLKDKGFNVKNIPFPSLSFSTKLSFNKVSTGLVETESIYILAENNNRYTTVSDLLLNNDDDDFLTKYQLMFFIDCREQNNFRFFTTSDSNITWSDRRFIDFRADNNYAIGDTISGYRVDIGFVGEQDGVYEDKLYIFLVDREFATLDYPGDAYLIGEIKLLAETEGEDERYRTFFSNFGIPDPKEHYQAFAETDIMEESLDYMKINDYSKKMFLSYDQIFPYAGTYKALINTLSALGYDDILFKEWYKETGTNSKNNLVAYNILDNKKKSKNNTQQPLSRSRGTTETVQDTKQSVLNTISNTSLEERVQLKKLNWISMLYKISQESSLPIDRFGFPEIEKVPNYYDNGTLVKLMSLKKYLETYILGSNCRIIDVGGEGVVFERYNTYKYGSYQQVLEYNNEKSVAIEIDNPHAVINEGKAEITGKIVTTNSNISFEDFNTERFVDYCDGFIINNKYKPYDDNTVLDDSDTIYCGKTLELNDNNIRYEVRSLGETESFRFGNTFLSESSPSLIIDDGEIFFDPKDLIKKYTNSAFLPDRLPIIQIKEGVIKSSSDKYEIYTEQNNNSVEYHLRHFSNTFTLNDVCTLVPPKFINDIEIYPGDEKYKKDRLDEYGNPILDENDNTIKDYIGPVNRSISQPSTGSIISYVVNSKDIFPYIPNETYGLRYTNDNNNNIPQFKIKGYNFNELSYKSNVNLPGDELMLSIIEGKMIFDDVDNNRKISINFKPNKNNTIVLSIDILQSEHIDGRYKFWENVNFNIQLTSTLNTQSDYTHMTEMYKNYKYEDAILYNPEIKLTYNNTGSYKVNVMMYDLQNNVFSSVSKKNITISTPYLGTMMYTNEPESNGWVYHESTTTVYPENDNNNCIYKYEPKRQLESTLVRSQHHTFDKDMQNPVYHLLGSAPSRTELYNKQDNLTRLQSFDKKGRFAQISNTTDKLSLIDINNEDKFLVFNRLSISDSGHLLKSNYNISFSVESARTIDNMARLCLYNSLNETLICSLNGYVVNSTDKTYFVFDDADTNMEDIKTLLFKSYTEIYCVPCWYINTTLDLDDFGRNIFTLDNNVPLKQNDTVKICYSKGDNTSHGSCLVVAKSTEENNINATISNVFTTEENIVSYRPTDDSINFYTSPIDDDYTSYIMKLSDESTVDIITGDSTRHCKKIAQHIGRGFTASVRDFDITIGQRWYENGLNEFKGGVTYGHTGQIITDGFVAMKTGIPKEYYYAECRGIGDYDDEIEMMRNDILTVEQNKEGKSFRWRIYKQNRHSNDHTLKVECFNTYPIFFIDEKGVYDIDVVLYDEYGNKFIKNSTAAITVI